MSIHSSEQIIEDGDILRRDYPRFDPRLFQEAKDESMPSVKACLALGQALNKDGSVPKTLEYRAKAAAYLFYKHNESNGFSNHDSDFIIMATGGDPVRTGTSEASVMRKLLVEKFNIPEKNILVEDKSHNTMENAYFSYKILLENKNIVKDGNSSNINLFLVTSDFHMPRASYLFEAVFSAIYSNKTEVFAPSKYAKDDDRFVNGEDCPPDLLSSLPGVSIYTCPCNSGCPTIAKYNRDDFGEGNNQLINQQTLLQRLNGEKGFLAEEVIPNLNKHILNGKVHVEKLSNERMFWAQSVVDKLIDIEVEKQRKLQSKRPTIDGLRPSIRDERDDEAKAGLERDSCVAAACTMS